MRISTLTNEGGLAVLFRKQHALESAHTVHYRKIFSLAQTMYIRWPVTAMNSNSLDFTGFSL